MKPLAPYGDGDIIEGARKQCTCRNGQGPAHPVLSPSCIDSQRVRRKHPSQSRERLGCDEPGFEGACDGLGAGGHIKFLENAAGVKPDGPFTDAQDPRNFPVGLPFIIHSSTAAARPVHVETTDRRACRRAAEPFWWAPSSLGFWNGRKEHSWTWPGGQPDRQYLPL